MPPLNPPPRLHLLPASSAPIAVILRRKPSALYHVMLWRTDKDAIEHGSWFRGRLYDGRCDLSPDGKWMVYLAMGDRGETWNGVCRPPSLKAVWHTSNIGTWNGGGFFMRSGQLVCNGWFGEARSDVNPDQRAHAPTMVHQVPDAFQFGNTDDRGCIFARLVRDGFIYDDPVNPTDEQGTWSKKPTSKHPALHITYAGYRSGHKFRFGLEGHDEVMTPNPDWACYDSRNQLLLAREGRIERWSLRDIKRGEPGFRLDLSALEPPPRRSRTETPP